MGQDLRLGRSGKHGEAIFAYHPHDPKPGMVLYAKMGRPTALWRLIWVNVPAQPGCGYQDALTERKVPALDVQIENALSLWADPTPRFLKGAQAGRIVTNDQSGHPHGDIFFAGYAFVRSGLGPVDGISILLKEAHHLTKGNFAQEAIASV